MKTFCILEQGHSINEPITLKKKEMFTTDFCDFYRLNWWRKDDPNAFCWQKNITWSEGRSILYELVPKHYEYFIFIDDDITFSAHPKVKTERTIPELIRDLLLFYKPLSGTFYGGGWHIKGLVKDYKIDRERLLAKEAFPIACFDLQTHIFSKSFADVMFPVIYHGSEGSMFYAHWACHRLYPGKQMCFTSVQISNTRHEPHQDNKLPQFIKRGENWSFFQKHCKDRGFPASRSIRMMLNFWVFDREIERKKIEFSVDDFNQVYNTVNSDYINRTAMAKTQKKHLILTTISHPNKAIQKLADICRNNDWEFLIIGDMKTPYDFLISGGKYYNIKNQLKTGLEYAHKVPKNHYARKNIGYLLAINNNAKCIIETDDDTIPIEDFGPVEETITCKLLKENGWNNIYRYFSDDFIWPRGFPLDEVTLSPQTSQNDLPEDTVCCPIQQGLVNKNPDVDAIYRLLFPLPRNFKSNIQIALGAGSWCPFNSQNTVWYPVVYPLLYLPAYCSFRMTDIWRSLVAQRICWENDWYVLFRSPTAYQERNEHDLIKDFEDEVPGYLNYKKVTDKLWSLELKSGYWELGNNMKKCYEALAALGIVREEELQLLDAWLLDMSKQRKENPSNKNPNSEIKGLNLQKIRKEIQGEL